MPYDRREPYAFDRLFRPGDDARMVEAVQYLLRNNRLPIRRPSRHQLKVGPWNFWPTSGKVAKDAVGVSLSECGLSAFARALGWPEPGSPEDGTWARAREARRAAAAELAETPRTPAPVPTQPCGRVS